FDEGDGLAIDGGGNIYVAGYSFATWGNPVRPYTSSFDGFAARLTSSGVMVWNAFLGGNSADLGSDIALDGSGNIYVTGYSALSWGSPVRAHGAGHDVFVAQIADPPPTATPSNTPTNTPTPTNTFTNTPTTPTKTPTNTPTDTPTSTVTATNTATSSPTATFTATRTTTPTHTRTPTPTTTPSATATQPPTSTTPSTYTPTP